MGIWESALILLGVGIVSQRFGAGLGLEQLGVGIRSLAGAPLFGFGEGLYMFSAGLREFAESLGDIGRGFGELFEHIPFLSTSAGGGDSDLLAGGGGNSPPPGAETWWTMDVSDLGIEGGMYAWAPSPQNGYDVWAV